MPEECEIPGIICACVVCLFVHVNGSLMASRYFVKKLFRVNATERSMTENEEAHDEPVLRENNCITDTIEKHFSVLNILENRGRL